MNNTQSFDMPAFREMQLGPYQASDTCGCLIFNMNKIRSKLSLRKGECTIFSEAVHESIGEFDDFLDIIHEEADNTVPNRRKAMAALEAGVRSLGFDVA